MRQNVSEVRPAGRLRNRVSVWHLVWYVSLCFIKTCRLYCLIKHKLLLTCMLILTSTSLPLSLVFFSLSSSLSSALSLFRSIFLISFFLFLWLSSLILILSFLSPHSSPPSLRLALPHLLPLLFLLPFPFLLPSPFLPLPFSIPFPLSSPSSLPPRLLHFPFLSPLFLSSSHPSPLPSLSAILFVLHSSISRTV